MVVLQMKITKVNKVGYWKKKGATRRFIQVLILFPLRFTSNRIIRRNKPWKEIGYEKSKRLTSQQDLAVFFAFTFVVLDSSVEFLFGLPALFCIWCCMLYSIYYYFTMNTCTVCANISTIYVAFLTSVLFEHHCSEANSV